ncbi:hypothetical protein [Micromonospora ureilytica]|uniref:hypothetical protein n=1 Tax=Micromonospora ureilytica TaxID=709868 RepID=UPI002E0F64F1|nr:hypothetical protein OHB55_08160 [Micromonospora ureilytica]
MTTRPAQRTPTSTRPHRQGAPALAPAGLALGLSTPTTDSGWLALGGVLLCVIGVAMAVAEWTRHHRNTPESPDESQPDEPAN